MTKHYKLTLASFALLLSAFAHRAFLLSLDILTTLSNCCEQEVSG
jgi:hypothetical protein